MDGDGVSAQKDEGCTGTWKSPRGNETNDERGRFCIKSVFVTVGLLTTVDNMNKKKKKKGGGEANNM